MLRFPLLLVCLACSGMAAAHSPYLLPNNFDLGKRDHVSVQASMTEDFFVPDVAMKSDGYHVVMPDGSRVALAPVYTKDLAVLDVTTAQEGTYRISTDNRTGRTAKAALLADGNWKFLRGQEGAPEGGKVHDVTSITRADVYVSRGTPTDTVLALTGKGLELQFLTHPNRLLAGTPAKLKVLYDGKPIGGQTLTVQRGALESGKSTSPIEVRCDAEGGATLLFATPGIYHVQLRHRFALPGGEAKAESHTIAITLEVTE